MSHLTMTEAQFRAHVARNAAKRAERGQGASVGNDQPKPVPTHQKYRNRPTGGYASRKEAKRAQELRLMQQAGEISYLREQVPYELIPKQRDAAGKLLERECRYVADFEYQRKGDAEFTIEDVKGVRTPDYIIKRKLMLKVHGIRIVEI